MLIRVISGAVTTSILIIYIIFMFSFLKKSLTPEKEMKLILLETYFSSLGEFEDMDGYTAL